MPNQPDPNTVQLGVRVPRELLAVLDAEVEWMRGEVPGVEFTRSDAVRVLLARATREASELRRLRAALTAIESALTEVRQ